MAAPTAARDAMVARRTVLALGEPIGGAAGQPAPSSASGRRARGHRRRSRCGPRRPRRHRRPSSPPTAVAPPSHAVDCGAAAPRRAARRRPAPRIARSVRRRRRAAARPRLRDRAGRHAGTPASLRPGASPTIRVRVCGLAPSPVLERRADRERRREAVRLLVRERARGRHGLGEAAVAVVRSIGPLVAIVLERDERTGR